jgi:putative membrane protein insertion efficiency factor
VTDGMRRGLRVAGWPARMTLIGLIRLYRVTLSGWIGGQCRFEPTCSHYGEQAVRSHGAVKGSFMAAGRIMRCQPFSKGGLDPVPPSRWDPPGTAYDGVTLPGTPKVAG